MPGKPATVERTPPAPGLADGTQPASGSTPGSAVPHAYRSARPPPALGLNFGSSRRVRSAWNMPGWSRRAKGPPRAGGAPVREEPRPPSKATNLEPKQQIWNKVAEGRTWHFSMRSKDCRKTRGRGSPGGDHEETLDGKAASSSN